MGYLSSGLLSIYLFGFETCRAFFFEVLPRPLRGEAMDPYNVGQTSFTALLHRLFIYEPELNPFPFVHSPSMYAVVQPVVQALVFVPLLGLMTSSRADDAREKLEWATFVVLLLLLSTNPASYHYRSLIVAGVLSVDYLKSGSQARRAGVLLCLYTLSCLPLDRFAPRSPAGWSNLLAFPRLFALMAL